MKPGRGIPCGAGRPAGPVSAPAIDNGLRWEGQA